MINLIKLGIDEHKTEKHILVITEINSQLNKKTIVEK